MAKKKRMTVIEMLKALKESVSDTIVDGDNIGTRVIYTKTNVGRKDTALEGEPLPAPDTSSKDGIWYDEMTDEQKKQYGIYKYGKK